MFKQRFDARTLLSMAALSAGLAAPVAHAGLLGGSGSAGGTMGARGIDLGGQARAGAPGGDTQSLPDHDKPSEATGHVKDSAGVAKSVAADATLQVRATSMSGPATGSARIAGADRSTSADPSSSADASGNAAVGR